MVRQEEVAVTRSTGTSWGAVIGGWLATVGVAALITPLVSSQLALGSWDPSDVAPAVPVIVASMLAFLLGGYVAGRLAGSQTSWHGMLSAFMSLFVILVAILLGVGAQRGVFGPNRAVPEILPGVLTMALYPSLISLSFGMLLGYPAAIFAGWLGGLLAPSMETVVVRTRRPVAATQPGGFRLLPAMPNVGRKGGDKQDQPLHERMDRMERK